MASPEKFYLCSVGLGCLFGLLTNPPDGDRSGSGAGSGVGEWKKNCSRRESKRRVGPGCDWIAKASLEVVHRD